MNAPASFPASSVEPRSPRLLDRLIPVSPQWRIPPRKAERLGWLQLLLGILVVLGAQMIVGLLAVATGLVRHGDGAAARPGVAFIVAISAVPLALLGYWLVVRFVGGRPVIELGGRGAALRELLAGLAVGALLMCTVIAVLALLGSYHVVDVGWNTGILVGLQAGIVAGFTEEILVRGVMLRLIEGWLGTWWALAITAVFFGAAHLGNPQATVFGAAAIALEAGILLGACYLLTRRLWLAIGVHASWNFIQGGVFGSDVSGTGMIKRGLFEATFHGPDWLTGGHMGVEGSVVTVVVCATAAAVILLAARRRGMLLAPRWRRPAPAEDGVVERR